MTKSELERLALDAYHDRIGWVAFWRANSETIRRAEPHDLRRYRRMTDKLMAIVISGNADGHHPIGDDDEPWEADDLGEVSDTETRASLQGTFWDINEPYV